MPKKGSSFARDGCIRYATGNHRGILAERSTAVRVSGAKWFNSFRLSVHSRLPAARTPDGHPAWTGWPVCSVPGRTRVPLSPVRPLTVQTPASQYKKDKGTLAGKSVLIGAVNLYRSLERMPPGDTSSNTRALDPILGIRVLGGLLLGRPQFGSLRTALEAILKPTALPK